MTGKVREKLENFAAENLYKFCAQPYRMSGRCRPKGGPIRSRCEIFFLSLFSHCSVWDSFWR